MTAGEAVSSLTHPSSQTEFWVAVPRSRRLWASRFLGMASATWRRFLVASLVIIAAYRILPPSPVVRMVAYNGFAACCVAGLCVATRRQRVKRRLAWYLITGGVLMFVLGDAIYTAWDPLLGTPPPFPNVGPGATGRASSTQPSSLPAWEFSRGSSSLLPTRAIRACP